MIIFHILCHSNVSYRTYGLEGKTTRASLKHPLLQRSTNRGRSGPYILCFSEDKFFGIKTEYSYYDFNLWEGYPRILFPIL